MAKYKYEFKPLAVIKLHRIIDLSIIQFLPQPFDRPLIFILSFLLRHLPDHLHKLILLEKCHVIMPLRRPLRRIVRIMIIVYYNIMSVSMHMKYKYDIMLKTRCRGAIAFFLSD